MNISDNSELITKLYKIDIIKKIFKKQQNKQYNKMFNRFKTPKEQLTNTTPTIKHINY